ncbi:Uncharacterized protein TPAR_07538 [Tolypocladium paradoxum]|uniref:Uncharacterized protein n=1 Tax=Tolypocladium paradoxum TaxID=94208 RepID=A0A2S4KPY6_9HYPO|nr:Uncharacterized protein TPAR_07538 [Tolypocladium paradoxum]
MSPATGLAGDEAASCENNKQSRDSIERMQVTTKFKTRDSIIHHLEQSAHVVVSSHPRPPRAAAIRLLVSLAIVSRFALHLHISQSQHRATTRDRSPLHVVSTRLASSPSPPPAPVLAQQRERLRRSLLVHATPAPRHYEYTTQWAHAEDGVGWWMRMDGTSLARSSGPPTTNHHLAPLPSRWDGPLAQPTGDAVQLHKSLAGAGTGAKQGKWPGRPDQQPGSKAPPTYGTASLRPQHAHTLLCSSQIPRGQQRPPPGASFQLLLTRRNRAWQLDGGESRHLRPVSTPPSPIPHPPSSGRSIKDRNKKPTRRQRGKVGEEVIKKKGTFAHISLLPISTTPSGASSILPPCAPEFLGAEPRNFDLIRQPTRLLPLLRNDRATLPKTGSAELCPSR